MTRQCNATLDTRRMFLFAVFVSIAGPWHAASASIGSLGLAAIALASTTTTHEILSPPRNSQATATSQDNLIKACAVVLRQDKLDRARSSRHLTPSAAVSPLAESGVCRGEVKTVLSAEQVGTSASQPREIRVSRQSYGQYSHFLRSLSPGSVSGVIYLAPMHLYSWSHWFSLFALIYIQL
jgi:hypothetical protein